MGFGAGIGCYRQIHNSGARRRSAQRGCWGLELALIGSILLVLADILDQLALGEYEYEVKLTLLLSSPPFLPASVAETCGNLGRACAWRVRG